MRIDEFRQRLGDLRTGDGIDTDRLRRRWERLRFRSEADYLEFVIARAIERAS